MRALIALLLLAAGAGVLAQERPSPSFQCQSSSECTHNSNGCNYCYQGACSCSLPAAPKTLTDAGTDTK